LTAQINRTAKITIDHDLIRRWAEARSGQPALVKTARQGNCSEGILRIDFPGGRDLEHISWDEWFKIFDEHNLVFLFQGRKANGQPSTFNKWFAVRS